MASPKLFPILVLPPFRLSHPADSTAGLKKRHLSSLCMHEDCSHMQLIRDGADSTHRWSGLRVTKIWDKIIIIPNLAAHLSCRSSSRCFGSTCDRFWWFVRLSLIQTLLISAGQGHQLPSTQRVIQPTESSSQNFIRKYFLSLSDHSNCMDYWLVGAAYKNP